MARGVISADPGALAPRTEPVQTTRLPFSSFSGRALGAALVSAVLLSGVAFAEPIPSGLALESALPDAPPSASRYRLGDLDLLSPDGPSAAPASFRLDPSEPPAAAAPFRAESAIGSTGAADTAPPKRDRSTFVAAGFTTLFLGLEYLAFWQSSNLADEFQWANEGWFDPDTYTGGADKASHLVGGYIAGEDR